MPRERWMCVESVYRRHVLELALPLFLLMVQELAGCFMTLFFFYNHFGCVWSQSVSVNKPLVLFQFRNNDLKTSCSFDPPPPWPWRLAPCAER